MKQLTKPTIFLSIFLRIYLFAVRLGVTSLPKVKGAFYFVYSRVRNKKGIILINVHNYKMYIDLADQVVSTKLLEYGFWEEGMTRFVKNFVRPGMVIVDCGAHIGYYSLLFSRLVGGGGKVFAFEPDTYNFMMLRKNIAVNIATNIMVENKAVSDENGRVELFVVDENNLAAHSIIKSEGRLGSVNVESVRLDDYLATTHATIDLIKMDIEGAEYLALAGMPNTLRDDNLSIIMEFYPDGIKKNGGNPSDVISKLQTLGFKIFIINSKTGDPEVMKDIPTLINLCQDGLLNLFCSKKSLSR